MFTNLSISVICKKESEDYRMEPLNVLMVTKLHSQDLTVEAEYQSLSRSSPSSYTSSTRNQKKQKLVFWLLSGLNLDSLPLPTLPSLCPLGALIPQRDISYVRGLWKGDKICQHFDPSMLTLNKTAFITTSIHFLFMLNWKLLIMKDSSILDKFWYII